MLITVVLVDPSSMSMMPIPRLWAREESQSGRWHQGWFGREANLRVGPIEALK
jgi:hypothetical protein